MQNTTALDDFATILNHSTFAINELVPLFNPTTGTIQGSCHVYLQSMTPLTKIIHHSDLTFVQTADVLSAAVLHDRISWNNTYQVGFGLAFDTYPARFQTSTLTRQSIYLVLRSLFEPPHRSDASVRYIPVNASTMIHLGFASELGL